MNQERVRIRFKCKQCHVRIFDYISGDMSVEIKCNRCKRVILMKGYTEAQIRAQAKQGIYHI